MHFVVFYWLEVILGPTQTQGENVIQGHEQQYIEIRIILESAGHK
jgi:hypothetical protein